VPAVVAAQLAVVAAFGTAVTALGPILYSTFQQWRSGGDGLPAAHGTAGGLLAAAAATLIGLFGSIGALAWVAFGRDHHASGVWLLIGLLLVSVLVAAYAVRTLLVLLTWAATPVALRSLRSGALVGMVTRGCCGETETRITVNLL
jgi:hypothetical protein